MRIKHHTNLISHNVFRNLVIKFSEKFGNDSSSHVKCLRQNDINNFCVKNVSVHR